MMNCIYVYGGVIPLLFCGCAYAKGYNDYTCLCTIFNWWVGMFYGVLPATFAYGHSINHHKYNNAKEDVITTSDKPCNNFFN